MVLRARRTQFVDTLDHELGLLGLIGTAEVTFSQNVNDISTQLFRQSRAERKSVFVSAASGAGVLLVTYSLYRLANAFTRGYFVWSLRTAAAVVASAAVLLLHMVVG